MRIVGIYIRHTWGWGWIAYTACNTQKRYTLLQKSQPKAFKVGTFFVGNFSFSFCQRISKDFDLNSLFAKRDPSALWSCSLVTIIVSPASNTVFLYLLYIYAHDPQIQDLNLQIFNWKMQIPFQPPPILYNIASSSSIRCI